MKVKYPRYTREEKLSCKLNNQQICEIRKLKDSGKSLGFLAIKYGVSKTTICYWVYPKYRKRMLERSVRNKKTLNHSERRIIANKFHQRKTKLSKKYREYTRSLSNKYFTNNKSEVLKRARDRYKKCDWKTKRTYYYSHKKKCLCCDNIIRQRSDYCRSCSQKLRRSREYNK